MINVAICTPTTGIVKAQYTACLLGMIAHYLNTAVAGENTRAFSYNLVIGSNIAQQREHMVAQALSDPQTTHVLFIDDDMGFESNCLNLALSRNRTVVLANYRKKNPPYSFTSRRLEDGKAIEVVTDGIGELEPVSFGGFGFCLIYADILRGMKAPMFLPQWVEHQGLYSTEDYPFFKAINDSGYGIFVDHVLSRKVWHIGDYNYQWVSPPMLGQRRTEPAQTVLDKVA